MHRRALLKHLAAVGAMAAPFARAKAAPLSSVRLHIDPAATGATIPKNFMGLGYEISSVAIPGLLAAKNSQYVQLVRNLGADGVIRVGGNTADYSSYQPNGTPLPVPKGTVIDRQNLDDLAGFLKATGWNLIWNLNLGEGTAAEAVAEARAVSDAVGDRLIALQIGNEPDLFKPAHRTGTWDYSTWVDSYRAWKAQIRQALPGARFAGPDVAGATDWVAPFAREEGHDAVLLTHHYYVGSSNQPASTMEKMLAADPKLAAVAGALGAAGKAANLPWRICETNSFSGGGKGGVSDTLGAALWSLDFMFFLASRGCGGVNMETGVNHLGFVSSYSPVSGDHPGNMGVTPEYYGLLAFARGGRGQFVDLNMDTVGLNLTAYATRDDRGLLLTIINKDGGHDAAVDVSCAQPLKTAHVARLTGPSAVAIGNVHFAGASVAGSGSFAPRPPERAPVQNGAAVIHVPASSAAVINLGI